MAKLKNKEFVKCIQSIQKEVNDIAHSKGWWDLDNSIGRNRGEIIALCHSELSECLEGMRHGNPQSEHIPEFTAIEEEAADVCIRLFDWMQEDGYRLGEAILAKIEFNKGREYKHGGKKF